MACALVSMAQGGTWGKLDHYDTTTSWANYFEIAEQLMLANDINDPAKKTAILISSMGPVAYSDLKDAVAPREPKTLSIDEIDDILVKIYDPQTTNIMERVRFYKLQQSSGQNIRLFVSALRKQASRCQFGAFLDEAMRDKFVCGLQDGAIQKRLLGIDKLPFEKAQKIALSMETAQKGATELKQTSETPVNVVDSSGQRLSVTCYCCGVHGHTRPECKQKDTICGKCGKIGHIPSVCRVKSSGASKQAKSPKPKQKASGGWKQGKSKKKSSHAVKFMSADSDDSADYSDYSDLYKVSSGLEDPIKVTVKLNGVPLDMEVDTGSGKSIISEVTYRSLWAKSGPTIGPTAVRLKTYTGQCVDPVGQVTVQVEDSRGKQSSLPLVIAPGDGPPLLGRSWLPHVSVDWPKSHVMNIRVEEFPNLFREELGTLTGVKVHLAVERDSEPRFFKPRSLPFALKQKVDLELDRLLEAGVISPVKSSRWAAPIVPVMKRDGKIRICGDYKLTVNRVLIEESYPLPTPEDLFSTLSGGVVFTKLDLSHAYNQLLLSEDSKEYLTINTHRGLFVCNRLAFGVSSAVAIFQREMETLLRGFNGVAVYLDDILVTGSSVEEHDRNLHAVLSKLNDVGLRLKRDKCVYGVPSVTYLGYHVSAAGLQPLDDRVRAIVNRPSPTNVTELQSFVGLITYYDKFLPHLSSVLEPLHKLLRKNEPWHWGKAEEKALEEVKSMLQSAPVLVHYDPQQPLLLSVDSSSFGIGCVLSHVDGDGVDRPIAFKSRKLSSAEKNYSQLDKEALAIHWGVKKFHKYVYGRSFVINTDHKPLLALLGEAKQIPAISSARLQRWAITLSAYHYQLQYKPGRHIAHADALSRLPYSDAPIEDETSECDSVFALFEATPVTVKGVRKQTERSATLSKVKAYLQSGAWPDECPDDSLLPYFRRKNELSLDTNVVMWGSRVVVPESFRSDVLKELHQGHPGMSKMKALARSYVWWPGLDSEIEQKVKSCISCQQVAPLPAKAPLQPTEFPNSPWCRLHMDFAGPVQGHMLLIIIDAYSKWIDVHAMKRITAEATIAKCRQTFAIHGLPVTVITDNGPTFVSDEFTNFMKLNGVDLRHSSAYHPSSNGQAENAVKTVKNALKKMCSEGDIETQIARFVFTQRITPHTTTGRTPAEVLLGRLPRSRLSLIRPDVKKDVLIKQSAQKEQYDKSVRPRSFDVDDRVCVRNMVPKSPNSPTWFHGTIKRIITPLTYEILLANGRLVKRHIDHLKSDATDQESQDISTQGNVNNPVPDTVSDVQRSSRSTKGNAPSKLNI